MWKYFVLPIAVLLPQEDEGTFIMFLFKNFSLVPVKPILAFDKKFGEILKVFIHFQLMDFHSPLSNASKQNNLVFRTWSEQFCPVS